MDTNSRIGDYEILGELGRGGMGRVYRVRNVFSDRIDAMKVLLPDLVGRGDLAARFLREIKLLGALEHPHIAALRTAFQAGDQVVMVMELVEGQSLAERLKFGAIPVADALGYTSQILDALEFAHGRGVVHRDIKPANMMLTPRGLVKLMDFGIARSGSDPTLTATGTTTGSLSYMSPEQIHGREIDARSDLYSTGISLYQMVTGRLPFQADSDFAVMIAHLQEAPKAPIELQPTVSPTLNALILTAISKEPAERFQSARAFRDALASVQPTPSGAAPLTGYEPTVFVAALPVTSGPAGQVVTRTATMPVTPIPSPPPLATPVAPVPSVAPRTGTVMHRTPPAPPPRSGTRHPAVYMVFGGLMVVGALITAIVYSRRADANPPATPAPIVGTVPPAAPTPPPPSATAAPTTAASATPPSTTPASLPLAAPPAVPPAPLPAVTTPAPVASAPESQPVSPAPDPAPAPRAVPQAAPPPPIDWDLLEDGLDQLAARALAINGSLDRMKAQQERAGFSLRGDVVSRQESMNSNITRALDAIKQKNAARAPRLSELANADVEFLEKFLGR